MLQPMQLRALQAVLATGSFAEAGVRLGFTASAVSQQVAALERATGLVLFERGPRSVRPTTTATALGVRIGALLGQLDVLEREIRAMAVGERGVVRIGSFPTASASLLPGALARLRSAHGELDVLLDEAEPDELIPRLRSATLDLVLAYEYDSVPQFWPRDLVVTPLLTESLILLTGRTHRGGAQPRRATLGELADQVWVASREETAGARSLTRLCAAAGFAPRVAYRSNDYNVVRGLVGNGLGVALVPALAHVDDPLIDATDVRAEGAGRRVLMMRRKDDPNPLLDGVVDALNRAARARAKGDRWVRRPSVRTR